MTNEETIHRFYSAFQKLDHATMQSCYHPDAVFSDPVFGLLDAVEVKAMWEMLCRRAKEFSLSYGDIKLLDEEYTTCKWTSKYLFAKTGRRVTNHITAYMRFKDGMIIEHTDAFPFYSWARQALGLVGWVFGWTNFLHKRIQLQARVGLERFMAE